ncbi:MAG: F0F1 ATP synthase subunit delta [Puniceicoccales bacterium]|jgi:F0F1-type ATP synthase delta subunit|nr:F0F1 ATP synthase subunit delta [Puniceicoccales bacterium]
MARAQQSPSTAHAAKKLSQLILWAPKPLETLKFAVEVAGEVLDPKPRLDLLAALEKALARSAPATATATVEYAGKLLKSDKTHLEEIISKKVGRQITLAQKNNDTLIGGIRVCVGDRRWEFSIRSALRQFVDGC